MCLHPGSDQSERVAGQLSTGAGEGPTAQENQNPRVGCVFGVTGQPGIFQALKRQKGTRLYLHMHFIDELNGLRTAKVLVRYVWMHTSYTARSIPA